MNLRGILTENSGTVNSEKQTKRVWEVSPFVVFGLCGFTLYLAWMFMVFISPTITPEGVMSTGTAALNSPDAYLVFRLCQVGTLILTLIICWRSSDALSTLQGVLVLLFGSALLIIFGFLFLALLDTTSGVEGSPASLYIPYIVAVFIGVGHGFMVLLWSSFLCMLGEHRVLLFVSLCVGIAAGLVLLMSFLQPVPALWITLSLALVSLGCFAYIRFRLPEVPKTLLVKGKASDKRQSIHPKSIFSVVLYSIGLGFAVSYIAASGSGLFGLVCSACAAILAAIIVGLDSSRFHAITENRMTLFQMPVVLIGIAPMFFDNELLRILGCSIILCLFMVVFIINLTALSEHVRIFKLNSIRAFGYGRLFNALGFIIGGFICYLAFFYSYEFLFGNIDKAVWTTIILLILIGIFVLGTSFVFEDHYPVNKNSAKSMRPEKPLHKAPEAQSNALPRGDLHTLSTYMLDQNEGEESRQSGVWKKRITTLSKECGLSPKETEVLFLLAKGRNAEFIQNELVVSRHTAKAHIYHIYQKTGVHSRQDLIDMLENVEVDYE